MPADSEEVAAVKRLIVVLLILVAASAVADPYTEDLAYQAYRAQFFQQWAAEMLKETVEGTPDITTPAAFVFIANILMLEANRIDEYLQGLAVPLRIDWGEFNARLNADVDAMLKEMIGGNDE